MKRLRKYALVTPNERLTPLKKKVIVEILVIEERDKTFHLMEYTKDGKVVSETVHTSIKDAESHSEYAYTELLLHWTELEGIKNEIHEVLETFKSIKVMGIAEINNNTIVKIGKHEITGFVDFQKCQSCHSLRIYNDKYDKYFCPKCNIWLEKSCDDPTCQYCSNLPESPLPSA